MSGLWIILGTLVILGELGCATIDGAKTVESGRALPTIQERLSQRVVTEMLITKDGNQYVVRDMGKGVERAVHVDQRTKLDPVTSGEMVRIYVTDEGHATTLQRVTE